MRYYIADLHFFHANMNTKMDHRGFGSVEEINTYMIQKWNGRLYITNTKKALKNPVFSMLLNVGEVT